MAQDEKYNGWTNYESWVVALWLDNEQGSQLAAAEIVAEARNLYEAAERLKQWHDIDSDDVLTQSAGVFRDMLTHALDRVNWVEVARHFADETADGVK